MAAEFKIGSDKRIAEFQSEVHDTTLISFA